MEQPPIYEGTLEEITLRYGRELAGHRLQVTIQTGKETVSTVSTAVSKSAPGPPPEKHHIKQLRGRGMLVGVLNTEDFLLRKRQEVVKEDNPLR